MSTNKFQWNADDVTVTPGEGPVLANLTELFKDLPELEDEDDSITAEEDDQ